MKQAPVSLCMIVRNEAHALPGALRSAHNWVREIVVVDTGSTDDTLAVARQHATRVEQFGWCDDFAAARNCSLSYARQPWVLVIDADETLLPSFGPRLAGICRGADADRRPVYGFVLDARTIDLCGNTIRIGGTSVRLFRNSPRIRYHGRVHEQVRLDNQRTSTCWRVLTGGPHLQHTGYDPSLLEGKLRRNLRLALLMLEDNPADLDTVFEIARTYDGLKDPPAARKWLTRCVLADPDRTRLYPQQWAYLDGIQVRCQA